MKKRALAVLLTVLAGKAMATFAVYIPESCLPVLHGFPSMEMTTYIPNLFPQFSFPATITGPDGSPPMYLASWNQPELQAGMICPDTIVLSVPCGSYTASSMYTFPPFGFFIIEPYEPGILDCTAIFQDLPFYNCTVPIQDLVVRINGGNIVLEWGSAAGNPTYRVLGLQEPWQDPESAMVLSETADTTYTLPLDPAGPRFFRVVTLYNE